MSGINVTTNTNGINMKNTSDEKLNGTNTDKTNEIIDEKIKKNVLIGPKRIKGIFVDWCDLCNLRKSAQTSILRLWYEAVYGWQSCQDCLTKTKSIKREFIKSLINPDPNRKDYKNNILFFRYDVSYIPDWISPSGDITLKLPSSNSTNVYFDIRTPCIFLGKNDSKIITNESVINEIVINAWSYGSTRHVEHEYTLSSLIKEYRDFFGWNAEQFPFFINEDYYDETGLVFWHNELNKSYNIANFY